MTNLTAREKEALLTLMPPLEDYERDYDEVRYGIPKKGEYYLKDGKVRRSGKYKGHRTEQYIILKRREKK